MGKKRLVCSLRIAHGIEQNNVVLSGDFLLFLVLPVAVGNLLPLMEPLCGSCCRPFSMKLMTPPSIMLKRVAEKCLSLWCNGKKEFSNFELLILVG